MNILDEVNTFSSTADKLALHWLFGKYHRASQWAFVAKCHHQRYGTQSYQTNRVWTPTKEGWTLYHAAARSD